MAGTGTGGEDFGAMAGAKTQQSLMAKTHAHEPSLPRPVTSHRGRAGGTYKS